MSKVPLTPCGPAWLSAPVAVIPRRAETLPNGATYEVLDLGATWFDDVPEVTVPENSIFVMGDHRDDSMDSRTSVERGGFGPVPLARVVGVVGVVTEIW